MSGFQRVTHGGSTHSYEDDDGYDPESNRTGPHTKGKSKYKKLFCGIFVLLMLGGAAAGAYVAYDKFFQPMWAENNNSAAGATEGDTQATEADAIDKTPEEPALSPVVPPEPKEDIAAVCGVDYLAKNDTSDCLGACAEAACCFAEGDDGCYEVEGAAAICDMYNACEDVMGDTNITDTDIKDEELPMINLNVTTSENGTDFEKEIPVIATPSLCGSIDENDVESCYEGDEPAFCKSDSDCTELGLTEFNTCLPGCGQAYANSLGGGESGPGGMLGFDGEPTETPSFCSSLGDDGTAQCLDKDCTDDETVCDTANGEKCDASCGPNATGGGENEGEEGPGGMLGFDGEPAQTPSFCSSLGEDGTAQCLDKDCTDDETICDTANGEKCDPSCGPNATGGGENEGEEGPGGMLGFDGEPAQTPSFCSTLGPDGMTQCLDIDCTDDETICDTANGEKCDASCGPNATGGGGSAEGPSGMQGFNGESANTPSFCATADGTCFGGDDCSDGKVICDTGKGEVCSAACGPQAGGIGGGGDFSPPSIGGSMGMTAAVYSICVPSADVDDMEGNQAICSGLPSDMPVIDCDPAVASKPGGCFCDPFSPESGCQSDQACTEPFCSLVPPDMPSIPTNTLCYTPGADNADFTCGTNVCDDDNACPSGDLCATEDMCFNEGVCCYAN